MGRIERIKEGIHRWKEKPERRKNVKASRRVVKRGRQDQIADVGQTQFKKKGYRSRGAAEIEKTKRRKEGIYSFEGGKNTKVMRRKVQGERKGQNRSLE